MPTGPTDLGFDVVANQPQTELNYRVLVDTSGTEASLASINAIQQAGGGGRLAFSTDAADGPLAQRMLIDNQGNVGIGTDEPNARLHVAGDANFNGPLNVQEALTVSGVARIGGDLSVTGQLTAASFKGNGAGLSNVTPADNSITSAKLAVDSASFSKVTGGKMVISADNVGIGTANPGAKLDVAGDAKFNGPLNVQGALTVSGVAKIDGDLSVTGNLTAASFAGNGAGLSNVRPADGSVTNAKLAQDSASLSKVSGGKMVISGDNVGVGTTSPSAKLHLNNASGNADAWFTSGTRASNYATMMFGEGTTGAAGTYAEVIRYSSASSAGVFPGDFIIANLTKKIVFSTANSGAYRADLVVDSSGNVGIGTTKPGSALHVGVGSSQYEQASLRISGTFPSLSFYDDSGLAEDRNWAIAAPWFRNGDFAIFQSRVRNGDPRNAGIARFCIDPIGNVGIGTHVPGFKLDVVGQAHATSFLNSSDDRLKTNIAPLTNVVERIRKIRGVSFDWNEKYAALGRSSNKREFGVLANEVKEVFPELVSTWGDENYLAVDYGRLTAVLLEAAKELSSEVEVLNGRIDALEKPTKELGRKSND